MSTFKKLLANLDFKKKFDKEYQELVSSDDIPSDPHSVPMSDKEKKKLKKDPLYQKRLKQNPDLKKNIVKLGENTMITVTYTSNSTEALSRQWHLMFHLDDSQWNDMNISHIKHSGNTHSFTMMNHNDVHPMMEDDYLKQNLVAGVTMKKVKGKKPTTESDISSSILDMDLTPEKMADILLSESAPVEDSPNGLDENKTTRKLIKTLESEEDDSKDGESDTIDDVQTMLTKMLPKTKNLKLGADKEKELKATLSKAMSLMGESTNYKLEEDGSHNITEEKSTIELIDWYTKQFKKIYTSHGPLSHHTINAFHSLQGINMGMGIKKAQEYAESEAKRLKKVAFKYLESSEDESETEKKKSEAFILESITESSPLQAKEAKKIIDKVKKITGWKNGKDVSDSSSDLVRVEFEPALNQIDSSEMKKLSSLGNDIRLSRTSKGWEVSKTL